MTVAQLLDMAWSEINNRGIDEPGGQVLREFALAKTAIEDARMRYTRGRAMQLGVFKPVDLDDEDALRERKQFIDSALEVVERGDA